MGLPPDGRHGHLGLGEQLAVLPPRVKLVAGTGMLVLALVPVAMGDPSVVLLLLCFALGLPLVVQGIVEGRAARATRDEIARAKAELADLRVVITDAIADRRTVEQCLIERGYTSAKARRWIANECDVPAPLRPRG